MTNTILGTLLLLSAVLIITLYSCNRNNTKSEITNKNKLKDHTKMSTVDADSVAHSTDTLQAATEQTDSSKIVYGEKIITDDEAENEPETLSSINDEVSDSTNENSISEIPNETLTETTRNLSLKENVNKPKTGKSEGSGIKATGALKDRQNKNTGKRILFVGSGGGVTGAVNEYRIEIDGSVYEKKSLGETAARKKGLKIDQIHQINQQFDALGFDSLKYNNPGNLYFFVGYELNGKKHQVIWGGTNDEVPEKVKTYYEFVINQLSE